MMDGPRAELVITPRVWRAMDALTVGDERRRWLVQGGTSGWTMLLSKGETGGMKCRSYIRSF
jgi:hypothetical protein